MPAFLLLVGIGVAYDVVAHELHLETLCAAFKRIWRHPSGRLLTAAALGMAAAHLFEETVREAVQEITE